MRLNGCSKLLPISIVIHVVVLSQTDFNTNHSRMDITFQVHLGPYVRVGDIYYTGNFRTKEKIMDRELSLKRDEPFSLKKMLEGQKNIRDMNIFDSVQLKSIGLKDKSDTIHLFVELEEKNHISLKSAVGIRPIAAFLAAQRSVITIFWD